ncbi:uncharacterized protein LOC131074667 isoform X2 [Cryptomeria japonica]|uniref:uncharacterized protein LOC131074667 isoform X2 n=1 Tax=Cryptomeria japonica TaxID=3369 RepID=UPI0027D9D917|nr:uncharacterized protein LOC131074667 isoform X2 [Cryptomeria japonica]
MTECGGTREDRSSISSPFFRSKGMDGYENDWFSRRIDDHHPSEYLEKYKDVCETSGPLGAFEGMIFMSNRRTKKECFDLKLFGLPSSYARVVKRVRPGMKLFLFEYERRQMYGVFEATSYGAMNIDCNAFKQTGRTYPAQVRFRSFWECYPLSEEDFKDAIIENYRSTKEFEFDLSQDQLFASQKIEPQVQEVRDHLENGQDLPRLDLQSETASLLQEVGRSLFTKELLYKIPPLREDCHVGKTIYGASDAEHLLNFRRECVHKDLQPRGDYLAGQNICEGDFQASQNVYDTANGEQRSVLHPLRGFTYTCKHDQLNSDFQPFYVRHPNITENVKNAFIPREILINETNQNASGEIYDNNTREVIIASNPQNHDALYYGETEMPCSTLSLDFLPLTLTNNVIDDRQKSRHVSPSISHANNISDSLSPSVDEFQDGSASDFIGLHKYPFPQPRFFSSGMHSLRSNNISMKPSVFSRLKRVQEIDVGHKAKHEDIVRETSPVKLPFHDNQRNFLSIARNELEVSANLDDNMQDAEASDEPILEDRPVINFKRRSQVCKDGKQVEGQPKQSCGEPYSCKPKRRKLIRPEFDSPKTSEASALPLSIAEKVQKCSIESKVSPQPENSARPMNKNNENSVTVNSPALNFQHISHSNTVDAIENESLPTLGCTTDYENSKCPECVPVLNRNVSENPESGFVQLTNETENKDLTDLSANRALSDCFEKGCTSQVLSPSTNKLDVINIQCDSGIENRALSANVTNSAESPNVQVVEGFGNENGMKMDAV